MIKNIIKKVIKKILQVTIKVEYKIISLFKKNVHEFMMDEICKSLDDSSYSLSYTLHLKRIVDHPKLMYVNCLKKKLPSYAIVLQGPLRLEDDYTFQTVYYYKQVYPEASVIVSTWENEDKTMIHKLQEIGAIVVQSELPKYSGNLNVNFQLVNSLAGIQKAAEIGAQYICKTRTDQRLTVSSVFDYFINLLELFPSNDKEKQKKRIITLAVNYGNMFYPYFVSDFLYFGTTDDMLKLFEGELDNRKKIVMGIGKTYKEYSLSRVAPEVFIMTRYLENIGHDCLNTVKDYWEVLKKYFVCVDRKTLGLEWPKYEDKYQEHVCFGDFSIYDNDTEMKTLNFDFIHWLNLYSGTLVYDEKYEKYVDRVFK